MSELPSYSQEHTEDIRAVPVFVEGEDGRLGHVEMLGVDKDGNPDPDDFSGYDPSEEDILKIWTTQYGHAPETPEEYLSYAELVKATEKWHDQLAGFGRSAIHGSCYEAGVHLPCDYSDTPTWEPGDGSKALVRATLYRVTGRSMFLTKPLADLSKLAKVDPQMTGWDMYPVSGKRIYYDHRQKEGEMNE